nr:MAG TPA: hypothetical protein [Caudoviricetes sp.]
MRKQILLHRIAIRSQILLSPRQVSSYVNSYPFESSRTRRLTRC